MAEQKFDDVYGLIESILGSEGLRLFSAAVRLKWWADAPEFNGNHYQDPSFHYSKDFWVVDGKIGVTIYADWKHKEVVASFWRFLDEEDDTYASESSTLYHEERGEVTRLLYDSTSSNDRAPRLLEVIPHTDDGEKYITFLQNEL